MVNKKGLAIAGVGAVLIGVLAFSPKAQDTLAGTGLGSALGIIRETAGGKITTTTTETPQDINLNIDWGEDSPKDIPTTTKKSSSASTGQSIKGGVAFRDSSGKLVGVQDDVNKVSRLPTPQEKLTNEPYISPIPTNPIKNNVFAPKPNPFSRFIK